LDFFFWWPCGIWPHKNTPYSKALGAELSTCPKKVTWLGFKCKLGLISIQRSWRVVGGLVHISPNIYLTKLQRRKNLQLPQSVLSFAGETWKLGVSRHGFHHKHWYQWEDDKNPTSWWMKMYYNDALQLSTLSMLHTFYWCNDLLHTTFKLPPLNAFLGSLIDFIQFSSNLFFNRMFEIEGAHVSNVQD